MQCGNNRGMFQIVAMSLKITTIGLMDFLSKPSWLKSQKCFQFSQFYIRTSVFCNILVLLSFMDTSLWQQNKPVYTLKFVGLKTCTKNLYGDNGFSLMKLGNLLRKIHSVFLKNWSLSCLFCRNVRYHIADDTCLAKKCQILVSRRSAAMFVDIDICIPKINAKRALSLYKC